MTDPLACQRHLFEIPDDVAYLDGAAWAPVPRSVREAGERAMKAKSEPWSHDREQGVAWAERTRAAAAALIGASAEDVAVVGSVSHAIATAARNLDPAPGSRILRVADEFPSQCYVWDRLARERDVTVEIVPRPSDGDWTAALADAITRPRAAPLSVAALSPMHWSDGGIVDLEVLAPMVRAAGAALVIDATQAVGAVPLDVRTLKPDFLAYPTYKWALGPYGLAFLYAASHRQNGTALEDNNSNAASTAAGARRYDKGERNEPVSLAMAATALELVGSWGSDAVAARLRVLTGRLAELVSAELAAHQPIMLAAAQRSPHIFGLRLPGGLPPGLIERLKGDKVFASDRLGGLRLSPGIWTNEDDLARCADRLGAALSA